MRTVSLLALLMPLAAFAATPVQVSHGWAPPSLDQPYGVGYLTLQSPTDDALRAVTSDCCKKIEIHTQLRDGDILRMRKIKALELPAGKKVKLAPGGYHLMLIGLKKPLNVSDAVMLELQFKHAPPQTALLDVRARGNNPTSHSHHH